LRPGGKRGADRYRRLGPSLRRYLDLDQCVRTQRRGLPAASDHVPGQAHFVTAVPALMHDILTVTPNELGDKGYNNASAGKPITRPG